MRNSTRNFIVEYKKRRPRLSGQSFWGGVDLKAVSRDVAQEIDKSFKQVNVEATMTDNGDSSSFADPAPVNPFVGSSETDVDARSTAETGSVVLQALGQLLPQAGEKRRINKKISPHRRKNDEIGHSSTHVQPEDDWVDLLRENEELKQRLILRIKSENDQMRRMLIEAEEGLAALEASA